MKAVSRKSSLQPTVTFVVFTLALFLSSAHAAAQEKILFNFFNNTTTGVLDGYAPLGNLVLDAAGNLYGTTSSGGYRNNGTVFELSPLAGGRWKFKLLYSFKSAGDGKSPQAGLILNAAGNLYGTTTYGGRYKFGTVFKLTPSSSGSWTETILHSFSGIGGDGANPTGSLVFDAAGNFYGTTQGGGTVTNVCKDANFPGCGTAFELSPAANGWTEKTLHSFGAGVDGKFPFSSLIFDRAGNLYGTTFEGGNGSCPNSNTCGTVFELSPKSGGLWTERVIHNFHENGTDGIWPTSSLILNGTGHLFGTTYRGGNLVSPECQNLGCGTVFELTPLAGGAWSEKIVHDFSANDPASGAALISDAAGNLYGTAGHAGNTQAVVFKLSPLASGSWSETVIYNFSPSSGTDGALVFDSKGNLYGTDPFGGAYNQGTVFEFAH